MLSRRETVLYLQKTQYWDDLNDKATFHVAEAVYFGTNIGWIVPKHAYYEHLLSQALMAYVEMGLVTKWYEDVIRKKKGEEYVDRLGSTNANKRRQESTTGQQSLSMSNVNWIFLLYMYAISGSILVFCFEHLFAWFQKVQCCTRREDFSKREIVSSP